MLERSPLYTPEHDAFRSAVRRFIYKEIIPFHAQWELDGMVPRDLFRRAGELGMLCMTLPENYGGSGADWLYSAVLIAEQGRALVTGPGFAVHSEMVAPYIFDYGNVALRQRHLPRMARGEAIGAIAMSEPDAGSDLGAMQTRAVREGDHYVIDGQKTYISNGQIADVMVVACKTNAALSGRGVSLFVVETDTPGFERGRRLEKMGLKAQDTSEIFFNKVRVPVENLLGEEGQGFGILMSKLAQERLTIALRSVTVARTIIDLTIAYTRERKAFGTTISDFQNTRFVLAGLDTRTCAAESFVLECVAQFMAGTLDSPTAARAKLLTTELHCEVVDACLQFFGGNGYMLEYPIARAYIDARVARIAGGASEVMKEIISRDLFGGRS
jgi:acyl-CoA dehydrogenase